MTVGPGRVTSRPASGRRSRIVGLVGVLSLVLGTAASAQAPARTALPPDFDMPPAESSPGTVTFSHARHVGTSTRCSTCHMRDFKMKRGASGPVTLTAKQEGKFCGACHDGKPPAWGGPAVFPIDECERCHRS